MTRARNAILPITVFVVGCSGSKSASSQKPTQVMWNQIGEEVEIIGPLGVPIAKIVTIEGHWVGKDFLRSKGDLTEKLLWAEKVDGRPLKKPVLQQVRSRSFQHFEIKEESGQPFRALGYSEGFFEGFPDHEAFRMVQTRARGFHTVFQVIEVQ